MSDASRPRAGKGPRPGKVKADKPGKGPRPEKAARVDRPGKAARAERPAKAAKTGLRGWDADAAGFSRTSAYETPEQAMKGAKRTLSYFQKAGRPVDVRLDGSSVTVRFAGPLDEDLKKLAKRVAPKDPAAKAEARARRAAQKGGDTGGGGGAA